jgi:hypothetical protein
LGAAAGAGIGRSRGDVRTRRAADVRVGTVFGAAVVRRLAGAAAVFRAAGAFRAILRATFRLRAVTTGFRLADLARDAAGLRLRRFAAADFVPRALDLARVRRAAALRPRAGPGLAAPFPAVFRRLTAFRFAMTKSFRQRSCEPASYLDSFR